MSPADRVTRERVAEYVSEIRAALAPYTVLARVQELCDALRVIAPEWNRNWLRQLYRTLRARVRPARDKFSRLKLPRDNQNENPYCLTQKCSLGLPVASARMLLASLSICAHLSRSSV